ncbi:DsbA family protein [Ruegeria sp. 2012CJ41-6]|uniref:DsbA family protein n=1 Tax=Ruegeria spongiae TaxID=2942209 RepID=A0ABT0Q6Z8_9RHOB|nr:DsbA family protein [Ruegeria spongiae]MCL6284659.1 DsbA family protein [Ruegeria spongiae]
MTRIAPALCAVAALAAGGLWLSQTSTVSLVGAAEAQQTDTIVDMVQGAKDAPVEIIEYASYTCPHCANFHEGPYKQLKKDFIDTGKVKFIYREAYFDRPGLWASLVARCGGPEKFFGVTDLIFQKQSSWARADGPQEIVKELTKIGRLAGIKDEQLQACLQDGEKAQTLYGWYEDNFKRDNVRATPSFIVNGEMVQNPGSYDAFKTLIEAELGS